MRIFKQAKIDRSTNKVLSPNLKHKITPIKYLMTNTIMEEIVAAGSREPALLLRGVEHYCKVEFQEEFMR
jgi:hypothetical protein